MNHQIKAEAQNLADQKTIQLFSLWNSNWYSISLHNLEGTMPCASSEHNFITPLILSDIQYFCHKNDMKWIKKWTIFFKISTTKCVENTYKHLWSNFIVDLCKCFHKYIHTHLWNVSVSRAMKRLTKRMAAIAIHKVIRISVKIGSIFFMFWNKR